jgi:superfamily II RNA helicase
MKKDLPLELIQKFEVSEQRVKILKADDEKKIVYAVVLEPESLDAHEDIIAEDEIEASAHDYLSKWRIVGHNHKKKAKAEIVESFIAPVSFTWNGQDIKKGSWVVAIRILDDQLWQDVKDEKLTGVSIGGLSLRKKV